MLVLVIGDLHIPHRVPDLHEKFKALLVPGKIHHILCPGNLCTEATYDYLKSICSDVQVTQGDFDDSSKWSDTLVQTYGQFRIGMCHGHQIVPVGDRAAAAILQRKLNTDILVLGHTHAFQAYKHEGRFVINPGSGTGAFSTITPDPIPSFVLMDIDGPRVTVYVYELHGEEVKVDKIEFSKPASL
ncbi:VPS29 [Auxenochlorella protothecoides x Auxenochlorella symbiontica]|uniref:Vacuolar protein sorting-associated protein 29 n=1 Tax=Auxenochlorella protothecoides TaxID=3075 RepID=A0A087SS82_AUXPR|nr:Vacuolar protein sorting-associated protein 29 [Auxenochlorella protothecoides]KFM28586.1 Vacuolar protein sorting-associated protein 29 [Auxenochlorella protothecoides]RMZ55793.1 hypothetical protein APUTEX25_005834 [Auxenochlorella protothecoides]|eukprot:RMZ55793.1 hypothetical protein APUTEX25_005834 [Auxenochlorella protothecoides]